MISRLASFLCLGRFIGIATVLLGTLLVAAASEGESHARVGLARPAGPGSLVLSGLTPVQVLPNKQAGPFSFQIVSSSSPVDSLKFDVQSSSPDLVDAASIRLEGAGANRTVRFTPKPHRSGSVVLTLTAQGETGFVQWEIQVLREFEPVGIQFPGFYDGAIAWGDADNDGDLDLLLGGIAAAGSPDSGSGGIYINQSGTLQVPAAFQLNSTESGQLIFLDLNQDGRADVHALGGPAASSSSRIYLQRPSGGFTAIAQDTRQFPGIRKGSVAWADADGDGDLDAAMIGATSPLTRRGRLVANLGGLGFTNQLLADIPALEQGSLAWGDLDGDGDFDLVVTGSLDGTAAGAQTLILLNEGDYFRPVSHPFPALFRSSVGIADMDGDGDPDIVVFGMGLTEPVSAIGINRGDGSFDLHPLPLPAVLDGNVALGDLDGDGLTDLVLTGATGVDGTRRLLGGGIWLNQGKSRTFIEAAHAMPAAFGGRVALGDMDQDGDLDLAFCGGTNNQTAFSTGYTAVFRNLFNPDWQRVPTPENLRAEIHGNDVTLHWAVAAGARLGTSYNIRVGTTPGAGDILSVPTSAEGLLAIPKSGNAGWNGVWQLRGLSPGTYYWSAQAVDAAFRGSLWTSAVPFVITNRFPSLAEIPDQSGAMNSEVGPIALISADPDGDSASMTFEVVSMAPRLFGPEQIRIVGTGASRSLYIRSKLNESGGGIALVRARDAAGGIANREFRVIFNPLTETALSLPSNLITALEVADIDRDGYPDFLLSGIEPQAGTASQPYHALFHNVSGGGFVEQKRGYWGSSALRGSWGDLDGDGLPDLAVGNRLIGEDGGINSPVLPEGVLDAVSAWGDFDGDGRMDLAYVGTSTREVGILKNTVTGWQRVAADLVGVFGGSIAWGDMDNDGDLDLALAGRTEASTSGVPMLVLYRNDGGRFVEAQRFIGVNSGTLQWGDYNQDGRLDLLAAGQHPDGARERIYVGQPDGRFKETSVTQGASLAGFFSGAALVDFDNDGALDLVEYTPTGVFTIRRNSGAGRFEESPMAFQNVDSGILRLADFDADGDFDILVSGPKAGGSPFDGATQLFLNHWIREAIAPTTLTAETISGGVQLRWPVLTGFGAGKPLTYNLRVGTGPGRGDVVSPMSDWATGKRYVALQGAQGFAVGTQLYGLAPGRYYWSIQAVDSTFQGSAWMPEHSFTVSGEPGVFAIDSVELIQNGVRLHIHGTGGESIGIQASNDLKTWREVRRLQLAPSGLEAVEVNREEGVGFFRLAR